MSIEEKTLTEKITEGLEKFKTNVKNTTDQAIINYNKPTPHNWRVVGDSILIIGTTLTTVAGLLSLSPYVIAAAAILTAVGKIITNFATK